MTQHPDTTTRRARRDERVAALVASFAARGEAELATFATHALARVAVEDLPVEEAALTERARAFYDFGRRRAPGERLVRVVDIEAGGGFEARTVLEVIGDDMPFLIDSLLGELNSRNVTILGLWHPVLWVTRELDGRLVATGVSPASAEALHESWIHVELERLSLPDHRSALENGVRAVFADVARAVTDWRPMLEQLNETMTELRANPPPLPTEDLDEAIAFLEWLRNDHFTFLGTRDYDLKAQNGHKTLEMRADTGLGLLRDPERRVVRRGVDRAALSPELQAFIDEPVPLIITKANTRSMVHRRAHMDYIGVKRFDAQGQVIGERRFVGLFTSSAYTRSVRDIPYLRRKVARAIARAGFDPRSHDGKTYLTLLETYPRDEIFQVTDDELFETSIGILRLIERPRTRLFVRWDKFDRFVSALVFVPRERYSTELSLKIGNILKETFNGRVSAVEPFFSEQPLARIHFIIGRNHGSRPPVNLARTQALIAGAARSWDDDLLEAAKARFGEETGTAVYLRTHQSFGPGYRETNSGTHALDDLEVIEGLGRDGLDVRLYRRSADAPGVVHLKIYHAGEPLVLSDAIPVIERLGLRVVEEQFNTVSVPGEPGVVVHDFRLTNMIDAPLDLSEISTPFAHAFKAVWSGRSENDGLNKLVVRAGLEWRDVTVLRAIARFLRQAAIPYSLDYMDEALSKNPAIAADIVRLFRVRFDPIEIRAREETQKVFREKIDTALEAVTSLDEDRILRRFLNAVDSMLRTSFFQNDADGVPKGVVAFKFDSHALLDLPAPLPMVEIFVYSPRVEGVHLRFGKVARGGLRWSDRREDFRTEILGLVKAQRVKNAVIVPVGAKGGFFPKLMPANATRDAMQAEGVACYKLFVTALLELTDNLVDGKPVPPPHVLRYDADDPYLVVAADKGTASFSDIANAIAQERGFWLGDAFASGGSHGYDHKKMGITARGAWEAVKRHFRELGKDIQKEPFTVIGVGDMSGDVFGNGMLLSKETKLVAAFDHRDIFIDPTPDMARSFAERERLFNLPRSSWADYDKSIISAGGGVFSRQLKSIPLTPEIQALTGLDAPSVPPNDLMRALLKADVDLLWFGGIGTFVKAKTESHLEVGDRANDAIRVDGSELRVKVVGEGANLGCTQRGRVEYARAGGHINTDAVDNSAGVNTSDLEVNIKILLDGAIRKGSLKAEDRDTLLTQMTDDVASLVLQNNYRQTLALTLSEITAKQDLSAHARFIAELESHGLLDRTVERLPDRDALREMAARKQGLTRPDLAVLIAYAKITLFESLLESDIPDDPQFAEDLAYYFPSAIRTRFAREIGQHRLRREIIATQIANLIVNVAGPTFVHDVRNEADTTVELVVKAFVAARKIFGLGQLYDRINQLDNVVAASVQSDLYLEVTRFLHQQTLWFLRNGPKPLIIDSAVNAYAPGIASLFSNGMPFLTPKQHTTAEERRQGYDKAGVPAGLGLRITALESLHAAADVVSLAQDAKVPVDQAARAFFLMGEALGIDRLFAAAGTLTIDNHWDELALQRLMDQIVGHQRRLTERALADSPDASGEEATKAWLAHAHDGVERLGQMITDFDQGGLTIGKLAVAETQLRAL